MAEPMKIRATLQGDVADVRILMMHPMETGQRRDSKGEIVPLHFIQSVVVVHNGRTVLDAQWSQAVSRNPFLGLRVKGAKAGDKISVTWVDNKGDQRTDEVAVAPASRRRPGSIAPTRPTEEEIMPRMQSGIAAFAVACLATWGAAPALAQSGDPLGVGRQMLAEDNPGELWIDQGKTLFYQKRGPKNASLEQCDFGLGPGKLEGASVKLPRYFSDTDSVQDLESRLLTCMVQLQGFKREDIVKRAISPAGSRGSDVEALALYVTSRSNGMKMNVSLSHQKEYDMYKAGEYLFYRRSGQTDFACVQCHGEANKRIRLQDLVHMTDKKQIQEVVSSWPAYRGAHFVVRTMQWRLYDCFWQMRLPELNYTSNASIALTAYLHYQGNGAVIRVPGFKR